MVYVLNREITFSFQLPNQIFSTNDQNVATNAIVVINALLTWNHLNSRVTNIFCKSTNIKYN